MSISSIIHELRVSGDSTEEKWAGEIERLASELATAQATYLQFCKKHDEKLAKATAALQDARDSFEFIRLRLIGTPEKSQGAAYCQAVKSRDASAAVLQEMSE